jgi:hypothetical protein
MHPSPPLGRTPDSWPIRRARAIWEIKSHWCSIVFREGEIVVQALQFALHRPIRDLPLPEEVVWIYIWARRQSVQGRDDVVGNDHCQRRFAFRSSETEFGCREFAILCK